MGMYELLLNSIAHYLINMIKNISYSLGINFINVLYPLILIPFYLVTFGYYHYGLISIVLTSINLINVFNDYSFYVLSPLEITRLTHLGQSINIYISRVLNTKLLLFVISAIALCLFMMAYSYLRNLNFYSIAIFFYLFSRSQNTHWIFLGTQKLNFYLINNTVCKLCTFYFVYILIKGPQDFDLLFYILGFFELLQVLASYIYLGIYYNYRPVRVPFKDITQEIKKGFGMFLTNLSTCALINSSTLILGLFLNPSVVAIYSVAEKIIGLGRHSVGVLFQGVFPYISKQFYTGLSAFKKSLRLQFKGYIIVYGAGCLCLALFPQFFIGFFTRQYIDQSSHYLVYMSVLPLITALSQSAYIVAVLKNKKRVYASAYTLGLLINLILSFNLIPAFKIYGLIASLIITEVFITGYLNLMVFVKKDSLKQSTSGIRRINLRK